MLHHESLQYSEHALHWYIGSTHKSHNVLQDNSLLQMPPWSNPWLLVAGAISFISHFAILYIPPLADTFSIVPLSLAEWGLVLMFALPVIFIDEVLKAVGRNFVNTTPTAGSAPRKLKQG